MDPLFDTHALRQHRKRAARAFSPVLFKEVAAHLMARLEDIRRPFSTILDITPLHTGTMRPFLSTLYPQASLCHRSEDELSSLSPQTFDCIISVMNGHWVQDFPAFLQTLRRLLCPDGLLLASFWGGESLHELRMALIQAETELKGGVTPRVIPMISVLDAAVLLQRSGFALPVVDHDTFTVYYPTLFSLGRHLRTMGESNALTQRQKTFTGKAVFQLAEKIYRHHHATPTDEIPATFQLITLTGWAPSIGQPKALQPGSARYSLKEALGEDTP